MSWLSRVFGREKIAAAAAPLAAPLLLPPASAGAVQPGQSVPAPKDADLPAVRREPPINIAPAFSTVIDCASVITTLDFGQFQLASWLIEQMLWNSRLKAVTGTRLDGLVGTEIRWEPGKNNDLARRAARDIVQDWPLIANAATRKQLSRWGLYLGVGFAQKHWYVSPTSGRMIPRLEVYHPQWSLWDWYLSAYRIWTLDGWALVPSPSLLVPGQVWEPLYRSAVDQPDTLRRWVVHEPFGKHSWRDGLVHAVWRPWLGHEWSNRDMSRCSEKLGIGIVKAKYPKSTDAAAFNKFIGGLKRLGSEGVIPVEVYGPDTGQANYDVEPFEWSGAGYDVIRGTKESNAADIAVLVLGHNTTAETKGASVGASAQVGNLIRGDIRIGDTLNELSTIYLQVIRDWAEVNYGDASVAPIPVYVTDPPGENQAAAQTLLNVTLAVDKLRAAAPGVDFDELLNRFRVPLLPGGAAVKPPPEPATAAPGQPSKGAGNADPAPAP